MKRSRDTFEGDRSSTLDKEPSNKIKKDESGDFFVSSSHTAEKLQSGMVILRGFLTESSQVEFAGMINSLGVDNFYDCNNEKTKRMKMMNMGRTTGGGYHKLSIPELFSCAAVKASEIASTICPQLPVIKPDICVVNYYSPASRLERHVDLLSKGNRAVPVVAFSLGDSAEFIFANSWKKRAQEKKLTLTSGDVLVFGGKSRGIVHAVRRILPDTGPDCLKFAARPDKGEEEEEQQEQAPPDQAPPLPVGRFNVNFRQF